MTYKLIRNLLFRSQQLKIFSKLTGTAFRIAKWLHSKSSIYLYHLVRIVIQFATLCLSSQMMSVIKKPFVKFELFKNGGPLCSEILGSQCCEKARIATALALPNLTSNTLTYLLLFMLVIPKYLNLIAALDFLKEKVYLTLVGAGFHFIYTASNYFEISQ